MNRSIPISLLVLSLGILAVGCKHIEVVHPTIGQACTLQQYGDGADATYYWTVPGKEEFRLRVCADMHIASPTDEEKRTTDTSGKPIPLFPSASAEIIGGEDHAWASFHGPSAKGQAVRWAE